MASNFPVSAQWTPPLQTRAVQLISIGQQLIQVIRRGIVTIADAMAADLRASTPKSSEPGIHVADGWTAGQTRVRGADFAVEVSNQVPWFDEAIEVSTGGYTSLGLILEYGSAPHTIEAKPGKTLVFYWPAVGAVVGAKSVEHPGTRPYGMMAIATEGVLADAEALIADAQRIIAQRFR